MEYTYYVDNASDINETYNAYPNPNLPSSTVNYNAVKYVQSIPGTSPLLAPHSPYTYSHSPRVVTHRN